MALNEQEDALARAGAKVSYTVTVVDAAGDNISARTQGEATIEGVSVTVSQGGVSNPGTVTKGIATFTDLRAGEAVVTVEAEGFTSVTYTTNLGDNSSFDLKEDNIETTIPIFPTTVVGGASEVSGKAWAETNTLNNTPEFAKGAVVRATISVDKALEKFGIDLGDDDKGGVKSATYSGFVQIDTVDANGEYELTIPNGNGKDGAGIEHSIEFLPFTAPQTYVKKQGDTLAIVNEDVVFDGTSHNDVDTNLSSVYATIEAPVNNASGFELMAEAQETALAKANMSIAARGSGYVIGDELMFDENDGSASYIRVDGVNDDGAITLWDVVTDGAAYSSKPGLTAASATGSGASFVHNFKTSYKVKATKSGSGYFALPEVVASYQDYVNGSLVTKREENVTIGGSVVDGKVMTTDVDGYITATFTSASMPTFTITNAAGTQAKIGEVTVEEDGTISSITLDVNGAGYTSQPKVTIVAVGDGMGNGATAVATLDGTGAVTGIQMVNRGSGYIKAANHRSHTDGEVFSVQSAASKKYTVKPGTPKTQRNYDYSGTSGI